MGAVNQKHLALIPGNMKLFLCVALTLTVSQAFVLESEWATFKGKHQKNYVSQQEHNYRKAVFADNLKKIQKHNAEEALGLHTFTLGVNEFADMTSEEFVAYYNGFKALDQSSQKVVEIEVEDLPDSIDWREKGYVTPVKNQASCGSCWAFSATGSMEGAHFKATGKLVSLSEQNLVDCSDAEGNMGCDGGLMDQAFNYTVINKGIDTEASYPYKAVDQQCMFNASNVGATISKWTDIPSGSEPDLQKAIATVGPISVGIDASQYTFQLYAGGIYYDENCSSQFLDHGVLAVGYGSKKSGQYKDYYLVKNSWGTDWGMKGYIEMSRNRNNNCGIATQASYPVI